MTAFKQVIAFSGLSRLLQSRLGEWGEAAAAATDCATFAFAAAHIVCATADPKLNIATKRRQKQHEHLKDAHKKSGAPSFVYTRRLLWVVVSAAAAAAPLISGRRVRALHLFVSVCFTQATAPWGVTPATSCSGVTAAIDIHRICDANRTRGFNTPNNQLGGPKARGPCLYDTPLLAFRLLKV
jgi:hypothetical protein